MQSRKLKIKKKIEIYRNKKMDEMWNENVIKVKVLVLHPVPQGTEGDYLVDPQAIDCKNEENREELEQ